jgi:hypothetical protein
MTRALGVLLLLIGCASQDDGIGDGGVAAVSSLCTTASCAAEPCADGCLFQAVPGGSCPAALPARVRTATVEKCSGFCGLYQYSFQPTSEPGYCWHYDPTLPGQCQLPICGWNVACEVHSDPFAANQATICPSSESCYQGQPVEDASAYCPDMIEVDLEQPDAGERD